MKFSTIKTTAGFLITLVRKYSPLKFGARSIDGIYDYLNIDDELST